MNKLNLDFETRSPVDLQKCGAYKYAEHPDTEVLVIAVSVDGGPVITWDKREAVEGNAAVSALRSAVEQGTEITAFNSQFEFAILKHVCPRQFGFPAPNVNQMRCSKAVALNTGIPSSLEKAAAFLRLGDQKDPVGKALIRRFSVPREDGTFLEPDADETFTVGGKRVTTPQAFQMFVDYCHKDVVVEMAVADALKPFALKGISLEGFLMTARMNDRGVPIDVEAVRMADAMIRKHAATLSRRFKEITGLSPSQNKEALKWLKERGYKGPNLDKHSRPKFGNDPDMSADAREAVHILGEYSYAAVKKIPAYLNWAMSDGKVRGCFTWHGAGKTGRHTSQGIQLQNQKKPSKKLRPIIESAYDDLKSGIGIEDFSMLYGNPYEVIASMARYFIRFDDMEVYDSDFTSVEALILPKLIGAERILDRFRSGEDLYIPVANRLGFDRDVGKTITLAVQFEGGWRAVHKATGEKLSEKECRAAVKAVQEENPEFKPAWKKFHDTWMHALKNPGSWHEITKHVRYGYSKTRPFPRMLMELPSGRRICLPYPQADPMTMVKTVRPDGGAEWTRKKGHLDLDEIEGFHTYELSYWGHIKDAVWGRVSTRGGDQLQTATQATGGDLLVLGCIEAEKRGFLPFLTVHDQVLVPARGDIADLENALCKVPDWFDGFPLQAESKKVRSYCK